MGDRVGPAGLPPREVLRRFGLAGDAEPLAGGEGRSVAVGDAVLKPVPDSVEAAWCARVLTGIRESGFRVARPVRAGDGRFVVDGWVAARRVDGVEGPGGRWAELLAAGRAFHAALRGVSRPAFLDRPRHRWAFADRVAWAEARVSPLPPVAGPLQALVDLRDRCPPPSAAAQVVHGDLTGNVLFAAGLPPAVIDFSPYWRPPGYAEAVAVVDGLLWHGAGQELVDLSVVGPGLLARAAIFRLVALNELACEIDPGCLAEVDLFASVVGLVGGLVGGG